MTCAHCIRRRLTSTLGKTTEYQEKTAWVQRDISWERDGSIRVHTQSSRGTQIQETRPEANYADADDRLRLMIRVPNRMKAGTEDLQGLVYAVSRYVNSDEAKLEGIQN